MAEDRAAQEALANFTDEELESYAAQESLANFTDEALEQYGEKFSQGVEPTESIETAVVPEDLPYHRDRFNKNFSSMISPYRDLGPDTSVPVGNDTGFIAPARDNTGSSGEFLINFTRPQFESLMEEQGLEEGTRGVLAVATQRLGLQDDNPITLESLKDGSHPILDALDDYKGISPENRNLGEEEILTIFTNVKRYDGQFDAGVQGGKREVPEMVGAFAGYKAGLATASLIPLPPPVTLPTLLLKGLVLGVGSMGGAISGAIAASKLEDALVGEADPVIPSQESAYRMGETGVIGLSMIGNPIKLVESIPKAKTGALEFLENFKQLSQGGKFSDVADEGFELWARNAGLKPAQAAALLERTLEARKSSEMGAMINGLFGKDLGIMKFNPAGYLFDPTKGPASARALAAIEGGVAKSFDDAAKNPLLFAGGETFRAAGMGTGAYVANELDPYGDVSRVGGEIVGSSFPSLISGVAISASKGIFDTMKKWYGNLNDPEKLEKAKGLLETRAQRQAAEKILEAIRTSQEYVDKVDADGKLIASAEDQLGEFIRLLGVASAKEPIRDADGNVIPLSLSALALDEGLPFAPTLRVIEDELGRTSADLRNATDQGKANLQAGSIAAVRALAATGDPQALRVAARIQQKLFETNIIDNMDEAVAKLTTAATRVLGKDPDGGSLKTDLSVSLYEALQKQINQSKARERQLWNEVKSFPIKEFYSRNGQQLSVPNVLQLMNRRSTRKGLNFSSKGTSGELASAMGKYTEDIAAFRTYFEEGIGRNPVTAERLYLMRRGFLNKAREKRKTGDLENANFLDKLADAALRDLTGVKNGASQAYDTARAYTFARNNVFTRSFLKGQQIYDRDGGLVVAPQDLLTKAFQGGYPKVVQRFENIRAAGKFLISEGGFEPADVDLMSTDDIMSNILRDSFDKIVKREVVKVDGPNGRQEFVTHVVDPVRLQALKNDPAFKELTVLLPELKDDLADAETARLAFNNLLGEVKDSVNPRVIDRKAFTDEQLTTLYGTKALSLVLQHEDPGKMVAEILKQPKPVLALNAMWQRLTNPSVSKELRDTAYTPEQVKMGLKQAIFSNLVTDATTNTKIDGNTLQAGLFGKLRGSDPSTDTSLSKWMISKGLATTEEMTGRDANGNIVEGAKGGIQAMIKTIRGVDEAFASGNYENIMFKNPSLGKLFSIRILGATAGGAAQNQLKKMLGLPTMGGGLIAESTGSELVQRLLLQGPAAQRTRVMTYLFTNPKAVSALLTEIKTKQDLDTAVATLAKVLAPLAKQTGSKLPILVRESSEEDIEVEQVPEPRQIPERSTKNFENILKGYRDTVPVSSTAPPPQSPVNPVQVSSAPLQPRPPIASAPQNPENRARFAALFPNDSASAMIRQQSATQGIGSLAG